MDIDPVEIGMALSSIPLFRELQRLLMAQSSPVNWEIAGQISTAVAQMQGSGDRPGPEEREEFEEACRLAQMQVGQLTGLESPGSITKVEVVDRVEWAQANLEAIRPFMERLSAGLGGALSGGLGNLGGLGGMTGSEEEEEAAAVPMSAALGM